MRALEHPQRVYQVRLDLYFMGGIGWFDISWHVVSKKRL
jgi:hypothetical protein